MIITRKIQLLVIEENNEKKKQIYTFLRKLSRDVFKAYNCVMSNQYFNDIFKQRIAKTDEELLHREKKLTEEVDKLTKEMAACEDKAGKAVIKKKRADVYKEINMLSREARQKAEELYTTSEQNSTYQLISKEFPEIPSSIRSVLNMDAVKQFNAAIFDVRLGKKSLPTFRDGIPIPIDKSSIRFIEDENGISINWLNDITFGLIFGRDKSDNRTIVKRMVRLK
jgi:hypothetical protein